MEAQRWPQESESPQCGVLPSSADLQKNRGQPVRQVVSLTTGPKPKTRATSNMLPPPSPFPHRYSSFLYAPLTEHHTTPLLRTNRNVTFWVRGSREREVAGGFRLPPAEQTETEDDEAQTQGGRGHRNLHLLDGGQPGCCKEMERTWN